jgi:VanZ family protein
MRIGLIRRLCRVLTWCCVIILGVLSLLPAAEMVRTDLPGSVEHFIAYAGSAAIAMVGYGWTQGGVRIVGCFCAYAGILEYLQHYSPGRHPAIADFAVSALGALCGGLAVALLRASTRPCCRGDRPLAEQDEAPVQERSFGSRRHPPHRRRGEILDSVFRRDGRTVARRQSGVFCPCWVVR